MTWGSRALNLSPVLVPVVTNSHSRETQGITKSVHAKINIFNVWAFRYYGDIRDETGNFRESNKGLIVLSTTLRQLIMIHLVYVSSATSEMDNSALENLLEQSRERNFRQNITGMMLYSGGTFMQILEGKAEDVLDIYSSIVRDERNTGNIILAQEHILSRSFTSWSMGFRRVNNSDLNGVEGFSNFLHSSAPLPHLSQQPQAVVKLLLSFRQANSA